MINHLYVHVPFCKSICYYCDFCHNIYNKELINKWLDALQKEIDSECKDQYTTIYIGGGTPNCLDYEDLDRLLSLIEPYSKKCVEYTIELNPECLVAEDIFWTETEYRSNFNVKPLSMHHTAGPQK